MNINKTYQNVDPELVHSELEAAVRMHGGKINDKETYGRKMAGGGFQGNIVATFPREITRRVKSGIFGSKEIQEQEWIEAFKSRVVGQTDKCILRIDAKEDIIGMGTITRIEEDLNSVVGSWETTER